MRLTKIIVILLVLLIPSTEMIIKSQLPVLQQRKKPRKLVIPMVVAGLGVMGLVTGIILSYYMFIKPMNSVRRLLKKTSRFWKGRQSFRRRKLEKLYLASKMPKAVKSLDLQELLRRNRNSIRKLVVKSLDRGAKAQRGSKPAERRLSIYVYLIFYLLGVIGGFLIGSIWFQATVDKKCGRNLSLLDLGGPKRKCKKSQPKILGISTDLQKTIQKKYHDFVATQHLSDQQLQAVTTFQTPAGLSDYPREVIDDVLKNKETAKTFTPDEIAEMEAARGKSVEFKKFIENFRKLKDVPSLLRKLSIFLEQQPQTKDLSVSSVQTLSGKFYNSLSKQQKQNVSLSLTRILPVHRKLQDLVGKAAGLTAVKV